ncbi:hypothetical protein [Serratia fonticola]|uniref:hypothetical protein n=1 Tax=Serratia fonticola TaxID=47917 RepID=UPI002DB9F740|nr:hypothetical protein [Serratia fonticola]MEB7884028.1 hypothetical protein [Serratia fonticola]
MSNKQQSVQEVQRAHLTATLSAGPVAVSSILPVGASARRKRRSVSLKVAVVDGCNYGRAGLVAALQDAPQWNGQRLRPTGVSDLGRLSMLHAAGSPDDVSRFDCLVVRLPAEPRAALSTLIQLGAPGMRLALTVRLVVLSALTPELVLGVLSRVGIRLWVRVVDDRQSLPVLCRAVCPTGELADSGVMAWSGQLLADNDLPQLSGKERGVLWQSLQMVTVHALARRQALSSKTLYTQRQGALHKLGAAHLKELLRKFRVQPGNSVIKDEE